MASMSRLINGDCLDVFSALRSVQCVFADVPDNLGLDYNEYGDRLSPEEYTSNLYDWTNLFVSRADVIWISFNVRWIIDMGVIARQIIKLYDGDVVLKPCVQTFTFGQHNRRDLGNNYRPLWRFRWKDAPLYPDQIRVPSWRQENGDKRAHPDGRVPGDVFDFPRVTGNSKQRRAWHPTQLHEDLVERCIKLSTKEGDHVCDPFAGTGTTLRVCKRINRRCTLIEIDSSYCQEISKEHGLKITPAQRLCI